MLIQLFLPHSRNNHKAKIRSSKGIIWLAIIALLIPSFFRFSPSSEKVLGYATAISDTEIVRLTNDYRLKNGLNPLKQDSQLNQAAFLKGQDMIKHQYWAHVSPTGVQPWSFITEAGYVYSYAGENLARDFGDSQSVVEAWMNSPSHKENILNPHYQDIGVSVVNGVLNGVETTLVIQEFGQKRNSVSNLSGASTTTSNKKSPIKEPTPETDSSVAVKLNNIVSISPTQILTPKPTSTLLATVSNNNELSGSELKISPINLSQAWSVAIASILILVFAFDWWLVSHKKIPRMVGKSWAHIMILTTALMAILSTNMGVIQ